MLALNILNGFFFLDWSFEEFCFLGRAFESRLIVSRTGFAAAILSGNTRCLLPFIMEMAKEAFFTVPTNLLIFEDLERALSTPGLGLIYGLADDVPSKLASREP